MAFTFEILQIAHLPGLRNIGCKVDLLILYFVSKVSSLILKPLPLIGFKISA